MKCKECRFWQVADDEEVTSGYCHRYPPNCEVAPCSIAFDPDDAEWKLYTRNFYQWPVTGADDWCGEWQEDRKWRVTKDDSGNVLSCGTDSEKGNA